MKFNFMEGHCYSFAVALHRIFGYQLIALYGEREPVGQYDEDDELIEDDEETDKILIHAVGYNGSNSYDFDGKHGDPTSVMDFYESINDRYDYNEIIECDEEYFWELVKDCGAEKDETAIQIAIDHINNNLAKYS